MSEYPELDLSQIKEILEDEDPQKRVEQLGTSLEYILFRIFEMIWGKIPTSKDKDEKVFDTNSALEVLGEYYGLFPNDQ